MADYVTTADATTGQWLADCEGRQAAEGRGRRAKGEGQRAKGRRAKRETINDL